MDAVTKQAEAEIDQLPSTAIAGGASKRLEDLLSIGRAHRQKYRLRLNSTYGEAMGLVPPVLLAAGKTLRPSNSVVPGRPKTLMTGSMPLGDTPILSVNS